MLIKRWWTSMARTQRPIECEWRGTREKKEERGRWGERGQQRNAQIKNSFFEFVNDWTTEQCASGASEWRHKFVENELILFYWWSRRVMRAAIHNTSSLYLLSQSSQSSIRIVQNLRSVWSWTSMAPSKQHSRNEFMIMFVVDSFYASLFLFLFSNVSILFIARCIVFGSMRMQMVVV